ncbi:ComEC/Rec2 family competence protein [Rhodospirillaceae bacterium AH-315-P19]|nr:ComEC/Rec2 family competence protein [Rhodospirillaceae bacterium AH-315-P19]
MIVKDSDISFDASAKGHFFGRRFTQAVAGNLLAERENWQLWLPVGLGLGIAIYFSLGFEPPLWVALLLGGGLFLGVVLLWNRGVWFMLFLAISTIGIGFSAAKIRTFLVAAPFLEEETRMVPIEGRIAHFDVLPNGFRVTLNKPRIEGIAPEATPENVRIRLRRDQQRAPLRIGEWVRVRGMLLPPRAPTAPGNFDFQRHAFFKGLGAVGFAIGPLEAVAEENTDDRLFKSEVEKSRQWIFDRVVDVLPGQRGAVAAALMTGKRGAIAEDVWQAMRNSGLAHLLAISGLHIGLVAGILFVAMRALLALIEPLALRYHIKKWAAVVALFGAFGYLILSGGTVPTQRAFLMIGLVLLAVLLDRTGISMRLVAWAAVVILLLQPDTLLGASFQLSFAAVIALVAVYEAIRRVWIRKKAAGGVLRRVGLYLGGVGLTTLVAGMATAPFAVQHFNRFAEYGLAANLVAVPITTLWIMPWAVLAFLLMPFGLEPLALVPMGWGVNAVIETAKMVAGWPGSVALLPSMTMAGLATFTLGGLWLCLWRQRWRYFGLVGIAAGLATIGFYRPPDILVSENAKLFAVRADAGGYRFSSRRAARFSGRNWLRHAGETDVLPWPKEGKSEDGQLACDSMGCIYRVRGQMVALVFELGALAEDCTMADVVISRVPVRDGVCRGVDVVIDRFDLWRKGTHAIWLDEEKVRVRNVRDMRGERPWVGGPRKRARRRGATKARVEKN